MKLHQDLAALRRCNLDITELQALEAVPSLLIDRKPPRFCDRGDARHVVEVGWNWMGDSSCGRMIL
jgi:hypothetical protein